MKFDLATLKTRDIKGLSDREFRALASQIVDVQQRDRRENQLLYYQPVNETALKVHESTAKYLGVGGGNGSSKTETCLVHLITMATGVFPDSLSHLKDQFRGPINIRVVVKSLTTVLTPIILPKFKWWVWTGESAPGGDKGHWGWVPKLNLVGGNWDRSWSEKYRMLKVICRDPDTGKAIGESTFQFMASSQDAPDFASGEFHYILTDEPSSLAIWRENEARAMRVAGRMLLAMTWPDDPTIPIDWIFDEIYEKGKGDSPDHDWFEMYTTDNPHLDQDAVAVQRKNWSKEMNDVRIFGRPIRFSNRIHPLFTTLSEFWCFSCQTSILPNDGKCDCGSEDIARYCHVAEFDHSGIWPTVFVLDPHPRKPHMFLWAQIDPSDDIWVVAEGEMDGDPLEVRTMVDDLEEGMGLNVVHRLMDPNMGRSPASSTRGVTWQDEFDAVGLRLDLADDSDVGRGRINEYLKPDRDRLQPRLHIHERCHNTIHQMGRYVWDEFKHRETRDLKQQPKDKYSDYPSCLRYLMNSEPTFRMLHGGAQIIQTRLRA